MLPPVGRARLAVAGHGSHGRRRTLGGPPQPAGHGSDHPPARRPSAVRTLRPEAREDARHARPTRRVRVPAPPVIDAGMCRCPHAALPLPPCGGRGMLRLVPGQAVSAGPEGVSAGSVRGGHGAGRRRRTRGAVRSLHPALTRPGPPSSRGGPGRTGALALPEPAPVLQLTPERCDRRKWISRDGTIKSRKTSSVTGEGAVMALGDGACGGGHRCPVVGAPASKGGEPK